MFEVIWILWQTTMSDFSLITSDTSFSSWCEIFPSCSWRWLAETMHHACRSLLSVIFPFHFIWFYSLASIIIFILHFLLLLFSSTERVTSRRCFCVGLATADKGWFRLFLLLPALTPTNNGDMSRRCHVIDFLRRHRIHLSKAGPYIIDCAVHV